jgi:hypothetical protein
MPGVAGEWVTAHGLACLTPVHVCIAIAFSAVVVVVAYLIHALFYLRPTRMKKELRKFSTKTLGK